MHRVPTSARRHARASLLCLGLLAGCIAGQAAVSATAPPAVTTESPGADDRPPNILLILVDDLGYTDLGSYGGNIDTPHLDALAGEGLRFTNAHAYPSCAPTRAALLTGQDPHRVGLGSQAGFAPPGVSAATPGYRGSLEGDFLSIAERLRAAGYHTLHVGKWDLGHAQRQRPRAQGFERNFSLLDGAASHYGDGLGVSPALSDGGRARYERDGEPVDSLPPDFYSTRDYTDTLIGLLGQREDGQRPFFAWLAYTAVHDPLHAPAHLVEKYRERFRDDIATLRERRIRGLAQQGHPGLGEAGLRHIPGVPAPAGLTARQQSELARRLAVHAAMLEALDTEYGRLREYLRQSGEDRNTVIILASDNGASAAPRSLYARTPGARAWQREAYPGDRPDQYGRPGSFATLGSPNAQAASGPFLGFKATLFEGGTRVPLIIRDPARPIAARPSAARPSAARVDDFVHLADLYPTLATLAGAAPGPEEPLVGRSLVSLLAGQGPPPAERGFGTAFMGWRAWREDPWKLVFMSRGFGGSGDYALYRLDRDPGETTDLSERHPARVRAMHRKWQAYAARNGIVEVPMTQVNAFFDRAAGQFLAIDWATGAPGTPTTGSGRPTPPVPTTGDSP